MINLDHLHVFKKVVEEGTFSAAARVLHQSQPNISLQVRLLEEFFGTQLIDRGGRAVKLTAAGEVVLEYVKDVLAMTERAKEKVNQLSQTVQGKVFLGAGLTVGIYLLPYLISTFHQQYPHIVVAMETANYKQNMQKLLKGYLDLAIIGYKPKDDRIEIEPFANEEIILIGPPDHPLVHRNQVMLPEVFNYPMIHIQNNY